MKLATMSPVISAIAIVGLSVLAADRASAQPPPGDCCNVVDNGGGTADMPTHCRYAGHMEIVDGLQAGDTIQIDAIIEVLASLNVSGTPATGTTEEFSGNLILSMTGTGSLSAYSRNITLILQPSGSNMTQSSPRTPFTPVQSFPTDLRRLQTQVIGDPDFDLLRVTGGTEFGMPSPGNTILTQTGSSWAVDSFFDVFHRVDFIGSNTSPMAGRSGSTTRTFRFSVCPEFPTPVQASTWGALKAAYRD